MKTVQKRKPRPAAAIRADKIDTLTAVNGVQYSCFLFVENADNRGDIIFSGCECGHVVYCLFGTRTSRQEFVSTEETKHASMVTCILFISHKTMSSVAEGFLLTGSRDRTIKVWHPNAPNGKTFVTTCYGHDGAISAIANGYDGSFLSCSVDGCFKLWTPQRGRALLLNPFFECTFSVSSKDAWLSALAVNPHGHWSCYIGDSDGNIEVYRKQGGSNDADIFFLNNPNCQLFRHKRWEKIHQLGLTHLAVSWEDMFLFSLSFDGTCKVSDAALGSVFFTVTNAKFAIYVGLVWVPNEAKLVLTDELGFLEIFSSEQMRTVSSVQLSRPDSNAHQQSILNSHRNPVLGSIQRFRQEDSDHYLVRFPMGKEGKVPQPSQVALLKISNQLDCVHFCGHDESVVGIGLLHAACQPQTTVSASLKTVALSSSGKKGESQAELISSNQPVKLSAPNPIHSAALVTKEEEIFFSASVDGRIICWGECDCRENFEFKSKGRTEVTSFRMIWSLNCIATGHDNGCMSLWHADSGSRWMIIMSYPTALCDDLICRVESTSLSHGISCMVECCNAHSQLLVGSDYSGKLAVWNLTLYKLFPSKISTDRVFQGFHEKDDPGIVSLAYHANTRTLMSGGDDKTIRMWRLANDSSHCVYTSHRESICSLECTTNFLLSGDENGELMLWTIVSRGSAIPDLSPLCIWNMRGGNGWGGFGDYTRACCSLLQLEDNHAIVLQANRLPGRSTMWQIIVKKRRPRAINLSAKSKEGFLARNDSEMPSPLMRDPEQVSFNDPAGEPSGLQESSSVEEVPVEVNEPDEEEENEPVTTYANNKADYKITVQGIVNINHPDFEPACAVMRYEMQHVLPRVSTAANALMKKGLSEKIHKMPVLSAESAITPLWQVMVYLGTTTGRILRYEVPVTVPKSAKQTSSGVIGNVVTNASDGAAAVNKAEASGAT